MIDNIITAAMLAAEQKYSINSRMPWCKETHEIMNAIYILQIYLSACRDNKNFDDVTQSKMDKLKSEVSLPEDVAATDKELRKYQKYSRASTKRKLSYETGVNLERKNDFISSHREIGETLSRLRFRNAEETKKSIKSLPFIIKSHAGPLTRVLFPVLTEGEEFQFMEVTDGKNIEDLIWRQNIRHFDQESDTPLATNETIYQFGFT